ncbi:MAG: hypothetical protein KFB93_00500 [Simkaniaceae bacterium]|nr:MAG: hypothetical protein KFB93_00500 [Simkaniaceae bacterium]
MNKASWVSFRHLLELRGKSSFLQYLSPSEQEKFQSIPSSKGDPFAHSYSMADRLQRVHYSWLITFLEPFAESDKEMILSSLDESQATRLRKYFKVKEASFPLKSGAKSYLVKAVYEWLISDQKEFLPIEFLPDHPLNPLVNLSKNELQTLVDYLGLHDLAIELKHVIKSEQIKKIQKVLTQGERNYLKKQIKVKEPITFARLNLDGWNGDGEKLKAILHHRGFNRLAKALFGCHPSLLWHVCHRLDTGRTKILRKFFTDIKNDEAHTALINQTLGLIPLVQKEL